MKTAALVGVALAVLVACGSTARRPTERGPEQTAGAGGVAGVDDEARCSPPAPALIRLTFPELVASVGGLLGEAARDGLAAELEVEEDDRAFPGLVGPGEAPYIDDTRLAQSARLAEWLGRYVRDDFAAVTGCAPDYGCVRELVADLGERAFRRPLSSEEEDALLLTVARAEALGVSAEQAADYGVQAVFSSPHFLYRTELGVPDVGSTNGELRLTDHELASALAFFVTGRAPDDDLRAAADAGELASPAQLGQQLQRLLRESQATRHVQRMLQSYLRVNLLETVVLDPAVYPGWSSVLAASMKTELEALVGNAVTGTIPVASLLTTRSARVDAPLAALYGIEFPPPGAQLDAGFADLELPDSRAGLLTRAGWSATQSRPDGPDLLGRGLAVRALIQCGPVKIEEHPPIGLVNEGNAAQRARARLANPECAGCHGDIDAFGLALEDLDGIGQLRTHDGAGSPIDASVTLPEAVGGAQVRGAVELSQALSGEAFAGCVVQALLGYALDSSGTVPQTRLCRDELPVDADTTLTEMLEGVVKSRRFSVRKP